MGGRGLRTGGPPAGEDDNKDCVGPIAETDESEGPVCGGPDTDPNGSEPSAPVGGGGNGGRPGGVMDMDRSMIVVCSTPEVVTGPMVGEEESIDPRWGRAGNGGLLIPPGPEPGPIPGEDVALGGGGTGGGDGEAFPNLECC